MRCPSCRSTKDKVIDSRSTDAGAVVRRRRCCQTCGRRFTTKERVEDQVRLTVIKNNSSRVPYRTEKIHEGVERACYKLPISEADIREMVEHVEEDLFRNHEREVTTEQIGRYVGKYLRRLNTVAYIRFMSVYRKYATVDEFIDEIRDVRQRVAEDAPEQQTLFET